MEAKNKIFWSGLEMNRSKVPGRVIINGDTNHNEQPKSIKVKLGSFEFELPECVNLKKYGFVETGKRRWRVGLVELRTLGKFRYAIRLDAFDKWHIGNIEDEETSIQYFIRMTNK